MDILRAVLGDEKLTYVGASYGTFLGATYADLFPDRVGRLVLDGAMDPSLSARRAEPRPDGGLRDGLPVLRQGLRAAAGLPARHGTSTADGRQAPRRPSSPASTRSPSRPATRTAALGESLATTGVIAAMYDESAWPQLREALSSARCSGDGAGLLALADSYYERDADGTYANLMYANAAVNCLDLPPAFTQPRPRSTRPCPPSRRRPPSSARASPGPP